MNLDALRSLVLGLGGKTILGLDKNGELTSSELDWAKNTPWLLHYCVYCTRELLVSKITTAETLRKNRPVWFKTTGDPPYDKISGICRACCKSLKMLKCRLCSREVGTNKHMPKRMSSLRSVGLCEICRGVSTSSVVPSRPSRQELKSLSKTLSILLGETQ